MVICFNLCLVNKKPDLPEGFLSQIPGFNLCLVNKKRNKSNKKK